MNKKSIFYVLAVVAVAIFHVFLFLPKESRLDEKIPISTSGDESVNSIIVTEWEWVDVMNSEGVCNGNVNFNFGESCGILPGGKIQKIGEQEGGDLMLYSTPNNKETFGTPCPTGTIFFVKKEALEEIPQAAEEGGKISI